MTSNIVLGQTLRSNLLAINRAQAQVDRTTERLSTNLEVNRAIDNPQNFFEARALQNRSADKARLLDGMGQSIRTIEEGLIGVDAVKGLLNQAEAVALESQARLEAGVSDPFVVQQGISIASDPLSNQILALNPDVYFRLNEPAGLTAQNIGVGGAAVNATYVNGVTLNEPEIYTNGGDNTASFNGINQFVAVPDSPFINQGDRPEKTVELVFNATTVAGRQVLYEEGGSANSFTMYIDNGDIYITGRDQGAWGPLMINAPVVAGQTYHAAFTFDFPNGVFRAYLNGAEIGNGAVNAPFPNHTDDIGIGAMNQNAWYHDGVELGTGNFFNGQISDVAIYNTVLAPGEIQNHADSLESQTEIRFINTEFENIMSQIDQVVVDANYRGVNLIGNEDLRTDFNVDRNNFLLTEGADFTVDGLGIERYDFNDRDDVEEILDSVRDALKTVREFGTTLVNDISIIQTRVNFTNSSIDTHEAGATDLTIADLDAEGANLLAAQTRLDLAYTALTVGSNANQTILDIVTGEAV